MKNNPHYKGAKELTNALADKSLSAVELLEATIARIEKYDPLINAVVVRDFERARRAAHAADAAIAKGQRGALLGLPMTVKESFDVQGLSSSWGVPDFKHHQAEGDALVVSRLKAAGAIILGKTNVPRMLADWQTYNEIYGQTNNPYDLTRTPGGSSGGSAAAVAAGFVSLELGSDLAGSLRTPAHFCGIATHKPSVNVLPTRGVTPPTMTSSSRRVDLAVVGPMARTVDDLLLGFNVMAGPDELCDGKGYKLALPPSRHQTLRDFRVLVLDAHPLCQTEDVITAEVNHLAENLTKLGVNITRTQTYFDLAEATKNYAQTFSSFLSEMPLEEYKAIQNKVSQLADDDQSLLAIMLRAKLFTHRDWLITMRNRMALREQWQALFKTVDIILCPVMPTLAYPHDQSPPETRHLMIDGKAEAYINQFAWVSFATLFDSPATVLPIARTKTGLPMGVQIIGDYLEDYTTLTFAKLLEQAFGGFTAPENLL